MRTSIFLKGLLVVSALALVACGGSDDNAGTSSGGTGGAAGSAGAAGSGGSTPSGGSGGTGGSGGAATTTCDDLSCTAPATCDDSSGTATCVCPSGFADTNGNGNQCDDIDECTAGTDDCDAHATCTNNAGGFDCACDGPAYTGDGKTCGCAAGYVDASGECLKANIEICADAAECASGNCVGGVCCAVACDSPGPCETVAGTVCLNGDTCQYGLAADDTACDDGNLCTTATCSNGECIADPAGSVQCNDSNACTTDVCDPATGQCVFSTLDCDDGNPCTVDTCNNANGCQYEADNLAACTDGDPCTVDSCKDGVCLSPPMDCSSKTDDCNVGVCNAGTCEAQPTNSGGACSTGSACDATGTCNGSGTCVGQDDACGPLATSCTTAGCPGDSNCQNGRICTCSNPAYVIKNGVCQEDTNECNADPCDPLATCNDPTPNGSASNDYVCTCPGGYSGGGTGSSATACVDIDECASGNPCGAPSIVASCDGASPAGSYTCTCNAGYTSIPTSTGPTCACDLGGTYELVTKATFYFDPVVVAGNTVTEGSGAGGLETTSWTLRHHTLESDGTITVKTIPCGGTSPTICSALFTQALAQYQGNDVWGKSNYDAGFPDFSVSLEGAVPGGSLNEPQTASLSGVTLTDPTGEWPPCQECIGLNVGAYCCGGPTATLCASDADCKAPLICDTNASVCTTPACTTNADCAAPYVCDTTNGECARQVTNRAQWYDSDENGYKGVSTWAVRTGGELVGASGPPWTYPATSVCPRFDPTNPPPYPWGTWPGLTISTGLFHTLEWRGATRVISQYTGDTITFSGGACVVSGEITGPDGGRAQTDARIGGCQLAADAAAQTSSGTCSADQVSFYDDVDQIQQVTSATFTMQKSSNIDLDAIFALATQAEQETQLNLACQELRATNCASGQDCGTAPGTVP